jgi:Raf kinase inhibitor-like YbhB/YbcL family protein
MAFRAKTPAFSEGERVPLEWTCDGSDRAPEIRVSEPPAGTRSYAIVMEDPDAPRGAFTHWLAYDIPGDDAGLRPAEGKTLPNDFGRSGYGGPCPPPGHGTHRYFFTVYAVDVARLDVTGGTRAALEVALQAHTLATARFMGRYERARTPDRHHMR